VALVHDWLVTVGGAERVLEQMIACYPQADLFCVVDALGPAERGFLQGLKPQPTALQRLPQLRRWYRHCLPLMPLAIEQLDLSGYDLVLSSSHAVAKGVLTGPDQCHVSYVHSPLRYAWDLQHQYLAQSGLRRGPLSALVRWRLQKLRLWDQRSAAGVDWMLANSHYIRRRIRKVYRRQARVLYPPVQVWAFSPVQPRDDYYVTLSRLVPYKRVPLIVAAFAQTPWRRLVVIGDGPDRARCEGLAAGHPHITLLGQTPADQVKSLLERARAFVFAAEEDFGIAPLEAQAAGCPVIAYGRGGCLETVRGPETAEPTGLWFAEQSTTALLEALGRFERLSDRFDPAACRRQAERFGPERFGQGLRQQVDRALAACRR